MLAAAIDRVHVGLVEIFGRMLEAANVAIVPDVEEWQDVALGTVVSFVLARSESPDFDYAERRSGAFVPVYRLAPGVDPDARAFWVGWYESWERADPPEGGKRARKTFDLLGVQLSFYWGFAGQGRKSLVFRAEWDKHYADRHPRMAPQPHWHVDKKLTVDLMRDDATDAEDLDVPAAVVQDLDAGGIHLGMGGWKNRPRGAWHHDLIDETELPTWVSCVLEHARTDFERLAPGEAVELE
jgi:hypothetical protein